MAEKDERHHKMGDPTYNNPYKNRFDKKPPKHDNGFSRIAYVLQGARS